LSYPFVGITGVWPKYEPWGAVQVEQALRDGRVIYFNEGEMTAGPKIVRFSSGKFQVTDPIGEVPCSGSPTGADDRVLFEFDTYADLATWVAFDGRDIL
jgi:hypothetical protein